MTRQTSEAPRSPPLERTARLTHNGRGQRGDRSPPAAAPANADPTGAHPRPTAKGAREGGKTEATTKGEASPTRAPAPHRASWRLYLGGRRQRVPATAPTAVTRASPIDDKATLRQA